MDDMFFKQVEDFIKSNRDSCNKINEYARIDLYFMNNFKTKLFNYIESNNGSNVIYFERTKVISEPINYDIRRNMDNDMIDAIHAKGYIYCENLSTSSTLVFKHESICDNDI